MNAVLRGIKERINQKVVELQHPLKPNVCPPNDLKNDIKEKVYNTKNSCISYKPWNEITMVVFDTETTGFYPYGGDEVISISGIVIENGEIRYDKIFDQLVNPCRPIPPTVEQLTGITNGMVEDQPNIYEVLAKFLEFIGDSVLIGHNVCFDEAFINIKLKRLCGVKLQNESIDTYTLSRAFQCKTDSHSLDSLIKYFGLPSVGRHTSLGDSVITAQLFRNLKNIMSCRKIETLDELKTYLHWRSYM